jgi:lipopolysaccharide/colanic/teichoic acid biosynthesis glycosyltransferase
VTGGYELTKRALDLLGASVGLTIGAPLLAASALAIRLEDGGPVFFRQERVGLDGRPFEVLKLRTMIVDAHTQGAGYAVDKGDSRITRVGNLLRRTSLDELPQLWNVLRGEMSLVGPRPTLSYQVEQYTERQRRRLEVRPGLTGWAQVRYTYGASVEDALMKLQYDLFYIKNLSLALDVFIMFSTLKTVLLRRGA